MSMLDALLQQGAAQSIGRDLGVDPQIAQTGIAALLPAVLGGMQNQAQAQPQGIGGLAGMLGGLGGGGLLDNVLGSQPTDVGQGNQVLGEIFGSKDTSRSVATHAAQQTGLSPELLKKMLPIVAMLAAGYLARQSGTGQGGAGGLGDLLGGMVGGGRSGGANPLNDILGGLMGGRR
jgi:hypothetical protein